MASSHSTSPPVGIDTDLASVERARENGACSSRTTFLHGDVFTHPFQPGSFDLVAARAMLHHVDAREGLRRMAELVRPGGTVAFVGFANPSGAFDWACVVAGFLLTRVRGELGYYWEDNAPVGWPPPLTMREMRQLADSEMPGATFGRALAHRYTIVWSRPAS